MEGAEKEFSSNEYRNTAVNGESKRFRRRGTLSQRVGGRESMGQKL